jgi:hypothetical protein
MKIRYLVLLVAGIFITNFSARADSVDHDGILRNQHGQVRVALTQAQAAETCAKHGMHLPTIRQMLKFYQAAGMLIKEVNEITDEDLNSGRWEKITAVNPGGKKDVFYAAEAYFNPEPGSDWHNFLLWTSSRCYRTDGDFGYAFNVDSGQIGKIYREYDDYIAVRCLRH